LDGAALAQHPGLRGYVGREVILGIRPEDLGEGGAAGGARLPAVVELRESLGSEIYVHFGVEAPTVVTSHTREVAADLGEEAVEELERQAAQQTTTFIARLDARSGAREGDRIELGIDPRGLHFFDPDSGRRIDGDGGPQANQEETAR
ncbi:MAG: multiple sugar transport system ATP-binding protein, partial [Thermoleophilaceae bacterium]|nr:multiple sugar transport system ATP-binding protein [Thermoleophilaceae bacterium]